MNGYYDNAIPVINTKLIVFTNRAIYMQTYNAWE